MSISQGFLTRQWAILIKSLRDDRMASLSDRNELERQPAFPAAFLARSVRHSDASTVLVMGL
jgi:hypothetical protein